MSGDVAYVRELPPCDIHKLARGAVVPAQFDGKTTRGPWAYMCTVCMTTHGVGLGLGRGQRLVAGERPAAEPAGDGDVL